jgi:glutathione S-transferase
MSRPRCTRLIHRCSAGLMLSDGRSYLTGDTFSPADGYLFTVTNWSGSLGHDLAAFPNLISLRARVAARPAVQAAMKAEGLLK